MSSPASRGSFRIRLSIFDTIWAFVTPWLALWIRDAQVLSPDDWPTAALYCVTSFIFAILAFVGFRIRDGMSRYFSVRDAFAVAYAVVVSQSATFGVIFTVNRLAGIPRSTPVIQALVLAAGLIIARTLFRTVDPDTVRVTSSSAQVQEHIIMIGATQISSIYMKLMDACAPNRHKVIAVLDDRPDMIERSIEGIRVAGLTQRLQPLIDEFSEHGIETHRVIVGGTADLLSSETMEEIKLICEGRKIKLNFVPKIVGLDESPSGLAGNEWHVAMRMEPGFSPSPYFGVKRFFDFAITLVSCFIWVPLTAIVAGIVLVDVGTPIIFWQQRVGMGGRVFLLQKFRSLKPSFDLEGRPIPNTERLSWVGAALRKTRFDELPQLVNVLVGEMSLIGPRPLLPHDQPNASLRLTVRPGITGWAQVNGGKLLTPQEKNELDEWYIRNASIWLDLRILFRTILVIFRGERR